MAAFLAILNTVLTAVWSFISPIKYYVLVAILSIVVWQKVIIDSGVLGDKTWDATATVVSVDSATGITVNNVSSDVLNRKRHVVVQGVTTDEPTLAGLLPKGTRVTIHVTAGHKLGAGQLTGVVDTATVIQATEETK